MANTRIQSARRKQYKKTHKRRTADKRKKIREGIFTYAVVIAVIIANITYISTHFSEINGNQDTGYSRQITDTKTGRIGKVFNI